MMKNNDNAALTVAEQLLKTIKKTSWDAKTAWQAANPGKKTLALTAMYSSCTKPFDADAAAAKASTNPAHEHYGKDVESIKTIWSEKSDAGKNRGNNIDDYIKHLFTVGENSSFQMPDDEEFMQKAVSVMDFKHDHGRSLGTLIGDEIWLFDSELGINMRCDMLFLHDNHKTIFIAEWKNINNFKLRNPKNPCSGPLTGYDDCDLLKVNLQVAVYKRILTQYFGDAYKIIPVIVNFTTDNYEAQPFLLEDSDDVIKRLATFTRQTAAE